MEMVDFMFDSKMNFVFLNYVYYAQAVAVVLAALNAHPPRA